MPSELCTSQQTIQPTLVSFSFYVCYSKVPAFLNIVDIAGLVKGAAEGQGLGNAFLSHIKACDAIFHLCRKFKRQLHNFKLKSWRTLVFCSSFCCDDDYRATNLQRTVYDKFGN